MVIGMQNKEIFKSILLGILVITSIILTYKIWNFTPNHKTDQLEEDSVEEKAIGKRHDKQIENVVAPFQLIDKQGERVMGMPYDSSINLAPLFNEHTIKKTKYYKAHPSLVIPELSDQNLVLDFTFEMPVSMYVSRVLGLEEGEFPKHFNMDRLIIDYTANKNVTLYAVSKDKEKAMRIDTTLDSAKIKSLKAEFEDDMTPYSEILTGKKVQDQATYLYATEKPKDLKTYRSVLKKISIDDLNSLLLGNTAIVHSSRRGYTTYNTTTGVAEYSHAVEMYKYKNLSESESKVTDMRTNIPATFNFINSQGGYTDEFRLFNTDEQSGKLSYLMYAYNRPVFQKNGLSLIDITWGEKGIFGYRRGLLKMNVSVDNGAAETELPSAEEVSDKLSQNPKIDPSKISNMAVSYDMRVEHSDDIDSQKNAKLIPKWFVKYDGEWLEYDDGRLR